MRYCGSCQHSHNTVLLQWSSQFVSSEDLKADSHIACRLRPCLIHTCHAMPMMRLCHALPMLFFSRPRHSTAVKRRPVGYPPAFGFFRLPCGIPRRLLSETYRFSLQQSIPTTVKSGSSTLQKDDLLNCWTSSSDISGYHADFHEGHCRSRAWAWRGMCELTNGMNMACYV